ncbi:tetratricopeptide repeat protein [Thalassobellus sediminis]|uniref:tetratricopeptide repeat protein n=1 Tax=Thalassobellus sediminis TaxID=3367753 RepID=UPI003789F0C0
MKKSIIIIFIVFPIIMFGQANKIIRKGLKTIDLKEKIELFTDAIELDPEKLDAYFYRAIAKNDLGDYYGAIADYSKIIVKEPDADTYYNRGNSRFSLQDFEGAKNDYAKAYELDKKFLDALYSLACVKFDLEEFNDAIKDFSSYIKEVPYNSMAYTLRAYAYKSSGNLKSAVQDFNTAVLIEPNADSYYNRGIFLMELNYYKEANSDLNKSIRLNKNNSFAYFYRGSSNLFLGKFNEAISDFSSALKFDSVDFDSYLGLAISYYKTNDLVNAKLNFDKANSIILSGEPIKSIEQYSNTYLFQNQYFYFNENLKLLVELK